MAKKRRKKKSGTEFSKLIMVAVMATYFIGLFFAMAIILLMMVREPETSASGLSSLLIFIAAPVSTAIGFYSYKAKNENIEKIKNERYFVSEGDSPSDV